MKLIKNDEITFIVHPILLVTGGLPKSGITDTVCRLLDETIDLYEDNEDNLVHIEGFAHFQIMATRKGESSLHLASASTKMACMYGILSGLFRKYHNMLPLHSPKINEDDTTTNHFLSEFLKFFRKKHDELSVRHFDQSLKSGIAIVNIWDFSINKAVYNFLKCFSGHFSNSYMWLFLNYTRDIHDMHVHPEVENDREGAQDLIWRSRLHYLLHLCKICRLHSLVQRNDDACKLIVTHTKKQKDKDIEPDIKKVSDVLSTASQQIGVEDVLCSNIADINIDYSKVGSRLTSLLNDIIKVQKEQHIPLSWAFFRGDISEKEDVIMDRAILQQEAETYGIFDEQFQKFCQFFTSFGSIFDVQLVDPNSNLVVTKPSLFFKTIHQLFEKNETGEYIDSNGILSMKKIKVIKHVRPVDLVAVLVSVRLAVKVPHDRIEKQTTQQNDFVERYYIPASRKGQPMIKCTKGAVQLVMCMKSPLINIDIALTTTLLSDQTQKFVLKSSEVINVTHLSTCTRDINLFLTVQGDVLEIELKSTTDQEGCFDNVCLSIVKACKRIFGELDAKYHFGVVCADDAFEDVSYNIYHRRHILPATYFCDRCWKEGFYNRSLIRAWNNALSKVHLNLYQNVILS